jgi:hypothetical protein
MLGGKTASQIGENYFRSWFGGINGVEEPLSS